MFNVLSTQMLQTIGLGVMSLILVAAGLPTLAAGNDNGLEVASPATHWFSLPMTVPYTIAFFVNSPLHNGTYPKDNVPLQYRVTFAVCQNRLSVVRVLGRVDVNGGKQTTLEGTNANWSYEPSGNVCLELFG